MRIIYGGDKLTRKLEEFFNIESVEEVIEELPIKTKEDIMFETQQVYSSLTTAEKVDHALPTVVGLDMHDNEMDSIAGKAEKTFDELIALGGNVPDMHAGKIYEVASNMLKIALEAKNAKAEKKLRMIELQLKKVRAEQIDIEQGNGNRRGPQAGEFDRNELLKYIVDSKSVDESKE